MAVSVPPHEHSGASLATYTLPWGLAIFPAIAGALFLWRLAGLTLLACGVLSAVLTEGLCALVRGRPWRVRNGHAALVGCLLALMLPTRAPGWLAAAGAAFGILFVQEAFGGNGYHLFHPALAGRLFLYLSWPQYFHRPPLPGGIPFALPEAWKGIGLAQLNGFLFQPGDCSARPQPRCSSWGRCSSCSKERSGGFRWGRSSWSAWGRDSGTE